MINNAEGDKSLNSADAYARPSASTDAGPWGHVLVAVGACVLTVAIVGSAVFLAYRAYEREQLGSRVREVVESLQNRTPAELAAKAAQVRAHPKLAQLVLPEVLRSLRDSQSERQQCSAIEILKTFLDQRPVQKALFKLRRDSRERVAGAAVAALAEVQPPQRAAEMLGQCLDDVPARGIDDTVIDEACAGLVRLGEPGRAEISKRLALLSADRRVWLVGYVQQATGAERRAWLEMLRGDADERVRAAAEQALQSVAQGGGASAPGESG